MPEEDAGPIEETQPPEDAAPEEGTPAESTEDSPTENWQQRYEDLRPEYTRASQRAAELERFVGYLQNPETQAQALAALGYEVEGQEPDELEPDQELAQRLERMEGFLSSRAENEARAEVEDLENELLDREIGRLAKDYSDEEKQVIRDLADRYRDDDDIPNVEEAVERFNKALGVGTERYRKSKRAPRIEAGQAGTEKVNLADDDERQRHMMEVMEAVQED